MDFELTDDQRMLSETISRFVTDRYSFEERLAAMREPDGFSRTIWAELAELGILGLPFAEADGGFGGSGVDMMVIMEAMGRGLLVEPFLATILLAGGALRLAGSPAQKSARIGAIIAGERIMALAHHEADGPRHTVERLNCRAERTAAGWRLSGRKAAVIAGAAADELVVSARSESGVSLLLVDSALPGVSVRAQAGYDGVAVAEITFDGVELDAQALLGEEGSGAAVLTALFEEANAALCAEATGIMADTLEMTAEYLRTRQQFGVAIGSFQALQHRAVDMLMQVELSRSMAMLAAISLGRPVEERRGNIAAAKAKIGEAGRMVGQQAVQLHGAIGLTMEYKVGHAFKRLTAIDAAFGNADHQLDMLADAGPLVPIG